MLLLASSEQKLVIIHCKISPQSLLRYRKLDHFASKSLKSQISREFKHWLWTKQSINFGFESAKRSFMNAAMRFFKFFLSIFFYFLGEQFAVEIHITFLLWSTVCERINREVGLFHFTFLLVVYLRSRFNQEGGLFD